MSIKVTVTDENNQDILFNRLVEGNLQEITVKTDKEVIAFKVEHEKIVKKVLKKNLFDMI